MLCVAALTLFFFFFLFFWGGGGFVSFQVASDFKTNWMYAIEILDDNSFIGAEEHGNLFAAIRDR